MSDYNINPFFLGVSRFFSSKKGGMGQVSTTNVKDAFAGLDAKTRLFVVEASCVYSETLTMKEAKQDAVVEAGYNDSDTFERVISVVLRDPNIKRLGFSLSMPLILNSLNELFDTCLLSNVDMVVVHHGGSVIVRFNNTSRTPNDQTCSLFLPITEIRMRAVALSIHVKSRVFDYVVPAVLVLVATLGSQLVSSLRKDY